MNWITNPIRVESVNCTSTHKNHLFVDFPSTYLTSQYSLALFLASLNISIIRTVVTGAKGLLFLCKQDAELKSRAANHSNRTGDDRRRCRWFIITNGDDFYKRHVPFDVIFGHLPRIYYFRKQWCVNFEWKPVFLNGNIFETVIDQFLFFLLLLLLAVSKCSSVDSF